MGAAALFFVVKDGDVRQKENLPTRAFDPVCEVKIFPVHEVRFIKESYVSDYLSAHHKKRTYRAINLVNCPGVQKT